MSEETAQETPQEVPLSVDLAACVRVLAEQQRMSEEAARAKQAAEDAARRQAEAEARAMAAHVLAQLPAVRAVRDHRAARWWMALGTAYAVTMALEAMLCPRAGYPALAVACVTASPVSPLYWWPLARLAERLRRLPTPDRRTGGRRPCPGRSEWQSW